MMCLSERYLKNRDLSYWLYFIAKERNYYSVVSVNSCPILVALEYHIKMIF